MAVAVRSASGAADFELFRELLLEYERRLPEDLQISDLEAELQNLKQRYGEPNAVFLAIDGARAVGCVAVVAMDASSAMIKRLYVAPEYRSAGAGRALMGSAIEFARSADYRRVVLDTDRNRLHEAYGLYVSLGFTQCAPFASVDYASATYMELNLR